MQQDSTTGTENSETVPELEALASKTWEDWLADFTNPGWWIESVGPFLLKILIALLILWIGSKIAKWIGNLVRKVTVKAPNVDETLANFFAAAVRYIILAFVVIAAIGQVGVQTASIIALLGAAAFAIGFALQGTLSNVAAGVMLMLFRPYKLGDYVETAGEEGIVTDINIFTTVLASLDNIKIIIANGEAWGSTIKNYTSLGVRRVDVVFGIHYDDDINKAIQIIKDTANADSRVMSEPHDAWAKVVTLNESSVDIQMRVWCKAEDYWDLMFDLNKAVKEAFDDGGITIPYPHSVELDG